MFQSSFTAMNYYLKVINLIGVLPFGNGATESAPLMSNLEKPTSPDEENRRAQLQRWIDKHFQGRMVDFIASTNDGERQMNQGELSALLRNKTFGERRARSLEQLANMPRGYLDWTGDTSVPKQTKPAADAGTIWPFALVSYQRVMTLQSRLGSTLAREAIRDIDEQMDLVLTKWERRARRELQQAK